MRNLISTLVLLALMVFPMVMVAQTPPPPSESVVVEDVSPSPATEEAAPQVADPAPSVAVTVGDVIVDPATDESGKPAVVIPDSPEKVGQQVVQAADNFKTGAWIAGVLALIGVALFFVNRYVKKSKAPPPKA